MATLAIECWLFENGTYQNLQTPVDDGLYPICSHNPIPSLKSKSNQSQMNSLTCAHTAIASTQPQDFYNERLENDFRHSRFLDLAKKEGIPLAKVQRQLSEGKAW